VLIVIIVFVVLFLVLPIVYLALRSRDEEFTAGRIVRLPDLLQRQDEQDES
jgi:hypothetical protein